MENLNLHGPYPYLGLMPYGILQNPVDYIPPLAAFPPVSVSERVQSVAGLPPAGVGPGPVGVHPGQDPPPPNYVILSDGNHGNIPVSVPSQNYFHLPNTSIPDFQAEWQQHQLWLEAVQYYTQRRHFYHELFTAGVGAAGGFAPPTPQHPSAFQPVPATNINPAPAAPLPIVEIRTAGGRGNVEAATTTTTTKTEEGEASSKSKTTCLICQETFEDESSLQKHFSIHVGDMSEKMFSCPQCPRKFSRNHYLTAHMQKHSNSKPSQEGRDNAKKAFQCAHCNKQFEREKNLDRHMRSQHEAQCQQQQQEDSSSNSSKTEPRILRRKRNRERQYSSGDVELKPETKKERGELENNAETDEKNNESVETVAMLETMVMPPMEEVSAIQPTQNENQNKNQDDASGSGRAKARKCSHPKRVVRVRGFPSYFEHEIPSEIDKNGVTDNFHIVSSEDIKYQRNSCIDVELEVD